MSAIFSRPQSPSCGFLSTLIPIGRSNILILTNHTSTSHLLWTVDRGTVLQVLTVIPLWASSPESNSVAGTSPPWACPSEPSLTHVLNGMVTAPRPALIPLLAAEFSLSSSLLLFLLYCIWSYHLRARVADTAKLIVLTLLTSSLTASQCNCRELVIELQHAFFPKISVQLDHSFVN